MQDKSFSLLRDSLLIFFFSTITFLLSLNPEFINFQVRFGLFAREMFQNGPSFFPTTYGQPYPDYPALSTLLIYFFSLIFGGVSTFTGILPTALISALILVVIYHIGALRTREWGLYAVFFTLLTNEFIIQARTISIDQYVSLAATCCFYLVYSADVLGKKRRLWLVLPMLISGFAFRGPIGLIIPSSVVFGYYLWERNMRGCVVTCISSLVLLLLCGAALWAAAKLQGGPSFVSEAIKMQVVGRVDGMDGSHSFFKYFTESFVTYAPIYPLAIIVAASLFRKIINKEDQDHRLLGHLLIWTLIVMTGMSVPTSKKTRYILSVVPALSLTASYIMVQPLRDVFLSRLRQLILLCCRFLPLVAAGAVLAGMPFIRRYAPGADPHYLLAAGLMLVLFAFFHIFNSRWTESTQSLSVVAISALVVIIVQMLILSPIDFSKEQTRPFVQQLEMLQKAKPGQIVFYRLYPDGDAINYMVNSETLPPKPVFIMEPELLLSVPEDSYIVTADKDFEKLPVSIASRATVHFTGRIGHKKRTVFSLGTSLQ